MATSASQRPLRSPADPARLRRAQEPAGQRPAVRGAVHAIQQHGRDERYNRRRKKYLYPGDGFKYWSMDEALIAEARVLNRMRIEDDLNRLRREGQID